MWPPETTRQLPAGEGDQADGDALLGQRRAALLARDDAGLVQGLVDDGQDAEDVLARRDLGKDTAVAPVDVDLRGHDAALDLSPVGHDRGGRLVTRSLDPQD